MKPQGRPLRALAGLGVALCVWIAVRLPAMQDDVAALAALAAPPVMVATRPAPVVAPAAASVAASALPARPLARVAAPPRPPRLSALVPPPRILPGVTPAAAVLVPAAAMPPPAAAGSVLPPAGLVPATNPAFALAAQAYDRLRAGQRRQAAALFDAALDLQPENRQWQADRRALGRRWQMGGFALLRDGGPLSNQPGSAASPVLGGGQIGANLAFLPDPYARRPLALVARANVAADPQGVRVDTAQLAVGLRQTLLPGVSLSIERLVPLGEGTQGGFTARLAAGGRWQRIEAYGEAGVIDNGQLYAGGQARARLLRFGPAILHAGTWASVQTATPDVWRVDIGPAVTMKIKGIRLEADWRQKVGGNAAPGSGPVLTVSAGF